MHFCQVSAQYKGVNFVERHEKSWTVNCLAEVAEKVVPMIIQEAQHYSWQTDPHIWISCFVVRWNQTLIGQLLV